MSSQSKSKKYQVIIVGAGPGGCSAALFLAKEGYSVLLLDRAAFPRDKICGDGITQPSLWMLDRMGVLEKMEKQNPFRAYGFIITSPAGKRMKSETPPYKKFPMEYAYVMKRQVFDAVLLAHLKEINNIDIIEGFTVCDFVYDNGKMAGVTGARGDSAESFYGEYIIGADGVHSVLARRLSLLNNKPRHRAFAVRAYFDNIEGLEDHIEIHYDEAMLPGYGWIFPLSKTSANVGVGVMNRFCDSKGINALFELFVKENVFAKDRLKGAVMEKGSFKGWALSMGGSPSKKSSGNVLFVGDAGSLVDPMTGEGIYHALRSGEYAAQAISEGFKNKLGRKAVGPAYEKYLSKEFKWKEYIPGYLAQPLLKNKTFINFSISRAVKSSRRARTLAGIVGHTLPKSDLYKLI